ncbi:fibrocystin-L-like isoform X3 [Mytilus californianus]|uniref:fibrocystin-L-like isoform X3 n=1 Tax=Mytilus californianus TaxID=6549 RepID=UPI0022455B5B|nr:fibrocystin-L-like isoform X3 [Mytilus californianus]
MKKSLLKLIGIVLWASNLVEFSHGATTITGVSPKYGSKNGGTRITISGAGFANTQFNFGAGNENLGNKVKLIQGTHEFECDIHVDGCTPSQATCYTRPMPDGEYTIRVSVDGVDVPDANHCSADDTKCTFVVRWGNTPYIQKIEPTSGVPGTLVKITGNIMTTRYGSNTLTSTNGKENKILRVYINGQTCDPKDTVTDTFYGLALEPSDGVNGYITCKMGGSYVGNQNISIIIDFEYGRSYAMLPTVLLRSDGKLAMLQTYAEVNSVSPAEGSTNGGTVLTITGNNFDDTDAPVDVKVGGETCTVTTMTDTEIQCTTPNQPAAQDSYAGGRGLFAEQWTQTSIDFADRANIFGLTSSAADYVSSDIDSSSFVTANKSGANVLRLTGYFVPSITAPYRFLIKADGYASLNFSAAGPPADQTEVARCESAAEDYWTHNGQTSPEYDLVAGNKYYMTVLAGNTNALDSVKVAARSPISPVTASMSGSAFQEIQNIILNSTKTDEVQEITISGFDASSTSKSEVQTVSITDIAQQNLDAKYRLGLDGVFTAPLSATADATTVTKALNDLASLAPDTVTVAQTSPSDTSEEFTITFDSTRGNLPQLTSMVEPSGSSLNIKISTTTQGVSGKGKAHLEIDGVFSPAIANDATASEVETALKTMFGVRCPSSIAGFETGVAAYFEDFEGSVSSSMGEVVSEVEPLCGRFSIKNPKYIYQTANNKLGPKIGTFRELCFGYQGSIQQLRFIHTYKGAERSRSTYLDFQGKASNDVWNYTCMDIGTPLINLNKDESLHRVDKIQVISEEDVYIDTVAIVLESSSDVGSGMNYQRYRAAKPGGFPMKSVSVTSSAVNQYQVTMEPFECGNNFDLFKIAESQTGKLSVAVTQTSTANPPITGSVTVAFEGSTLRIPVDSTEEQLKVLLESRFKDTMGQVEVVHQGDCSNFAWTITFLTNRGDQSEITISDQSNLNGASPSAKTETVRNGGHMLDTMGGDYLRTPHAKPQVVVGINNVPSKCAGTCAFEWKSDSTPTFSWASPVQGTQALGTELTIDGSGFSLTQTDNTVTIGGVECTVTAAASTYLKCNVGNGPMGQFPILVKVAGKGQASGSIQFTYTAEITGISGQTSGSLAGGTVVTITGSGFAPDVDIQFDGVSAVVQTSEPGQVVCLTPKGSSAASVAVTGVQYGNTLTSPTQFTYDASKTATMSSISSNEASVFGGKSITISGSGFGGSASSADAIKINGKAATITSYSDTSVIATLPANAPGTYSIGFSIGSDGYASVAANVVGTVTYQLTVTDIYPTQGSLYGGSLVTVFGRGFGTNASLVDISFGAYKCQIQDIADTELTCLTSTTAKTHVVTNQGSHSTYGAGFAWDQLTLTVEEGDTINWQWSLSTNGYTLGVYQSDNITATADKSGGFSSGDASASGSYKYHTYRPTSFTYWSGLADGISISLHGQVEVTGRVDSVHNLVLTGNGYEATYDTTNKGSTTPSNSGACPWDTTAISSCSALTGDADKFNFMYQSCMTGTVSSISNNQRSAAHTIDIAGTGFSAQSCQNKIKLGDYFCVVSSASATKVTCTIDPQGKMQIGNVEHFDVSSFNRGQFLLELPTDAKRSFLLLPHVSSMSPESGSVEGGQVVTISGGGFIPGETTVIIGMSDCPVISVDYSTLTCTLPRAGREGFKNVKVTVTASDGQKGDAVCSSTSSTLCSYQYKSDETPTVTGVTPDTISGSTTLTISGTNFGTDTSAVSVTIGGEVCSVSAVTGTSITCTVPSAPVGDQTVNVNVASLGKASTTVVVTSSPTLTSITPSSGSTEGKTVVVIVGNGFVVNKTEVIIDGNQCEIVTVLLTSIECSTPAGTDGAKTVTVLSNGVTYTSTLTFTYGTAMTPSVTSISPTSGQIGDTVTITGTKFDTVTGNNVVKVGGATCSVSSATTTSVMCTLGVQSPGQYDVMVNVNPMGRAGSSVQFTYAMTVSSVNPTSGSLGGGQVITIAGLGFDPQTSKVIICGQECTVDKAASTTTNLVCSTPASTGSVTVSCDVEVIDNGQTAASTYQYDSAASPSITSVSPSIGGTSGGTTLTIEGTGFGSSTSDVSVTIGGIACVVQTVANTKVVCITGARNSGSTDAQVELQVNGGGNARQVGADFSYVWAWSSTNSWGGKNPPVEGEIVVIPAGMTILLDQSTPKLKTLLLQGGKLIFDEQDIELNSEYILITNGGALQVGTEDKPFQSNAIIRLHGAFRSEELPIYGSKVLAVREGTLDLHGIPTPVTWTHLAQTANAGDTTITLMATVNWPVGSQIVLPTTGHRHSQSQSETKTITAISGKTLTLDSALANKHVAESETFGSTTVELRGEVGLLSHNVKFQGSSDVQFNDEIKACPEGFNTGEFTTQTCFQGRFGDEIGSDQFGGHILIHPAEKDKDLAVARISHIEVSHAGQAFRLGRYPIHFHILGITTKSYVSGCGIHNTFNRAVNVHGTHGLVVERTVIYNIMGGAFFLEDGVETGNSFQYNLAVKVIASTSLLNDDITPAAYWVTNPNNTIQHNTAAGGTHFGFWYRMHDHPDGPSFDPNVCPKHVPLGVFQNNTVHSQGWFGIWIFHDYLPKADGACSSSSAMTVAVFNTLTVWNCEKGAEFVNIGAAQLVGLVAVHNEKAGYEGKLVIETPQFDETNGHAVKDSVIVARSQHLDKQPDWRSSGQGCTVGGIVLPYGNGLIVSGVSFYNFDESSCQAFTYTKIDGTCSEFCGGFTYHFKNIAFDTASSSHRVRFDWLHEGVMVDLDGTLSGQAAGSSIVPTMTHLPSSCSSISNGFTMALPASSCPPGISFHRMSFNGISPASLKGKDVMITNQYGTERGYFKDKRITHKDGWVFLLIGGENHKVRFENAAHVTNISYTGVFYEFNDATDYVEVCHLLDQKPDKFYWQGSAAGQNMSTSALDLSRNKHGDWFFDNVTNDMCFMVAGKLQRKRSSPGLVVNSVDRPMKVDSFKCYFKDCIPPPDPDTIPPTCTRPSDIQVWSDTSIWDVDADGYVSNVGSGTHGLPKAGDMKLKIKKDTWVVGDTSIPQLDSLVLEGVLELSHGPSKDRQFTIDVMYLYIQGGRLIIGCQESSPFEGLATIILRGDHSTPVWPKTEGPNIGSKAIAVFGGLDLHGKDVGKSWTKLQQTASAGSNQIVLSETVTWSAGDDIIITATGYEVNEAEKHTIQSVAGDQKTITLTSNLAYKHIVASESFANGQSYSISAEVGLLTGRNIRIIGEEYADIEKESFGARVIVGVTADATRTYTGYARIANVEFYRGAQEGFTAPHDPRHAISFMDIGTLTDIKPCYVKKSSFNYVYGSAIGVYGVHGLELQDNVIYRTVGPGIETRSTDTRIRRNLMALSLFRGSYNGRYESFNLDYKGMIEAIGASELVIQGNAISSFERVGLHSQAEDCSSTTEPWTDNTIHTGLIGTAVFPSDTSDPAFVTTDRCLQLANFTVWKCWDFGLYYNSLFDIVVKKNTVLENGVGIFPFVYGPSAVDHIFVDHYMKIENNLVVGQTAAFDCTTDVIDTNDANFKISGKFGRAWRVNGKGKVGLSTPNFSQSGNAATIKPFYNQMAYQSLGGRMEVIDTTFANFKSTCGQDTAVATNPMMHDAILPMLMSRSSMYNVDNKLYMDRPNVGKANPSDCVDMTCDGHRKALIKDSDGSFLGAAGDALSQAEYQWDGDARYGLGDYRIPKPMLTYPDGTRGDYDVIAKYKGIIRDDTCQYKAESQAYVCTGYNYEQIVIENMDADTEDRRLSPVGVLGWNDNGDGFMDLINGPQDHGWCSGYTCQKRLSTFTSVMATGRNYSVYFTSTSPQHLRYRMLNSDNSKAVGIATYYNVPNRLDIYCDGTYVLPSNGYKDSEDRVLLNAPTTWDEFIPDPATDACGTNYLDYDWKHQHIILRGAGVVDIKINPVIVLGFNVPSLTVDQFFGDDLVNNLALFLKVPASKIRVMNVVTGADKRRRRRRSTGPNTVYTVEIGNQPCSDINCTSTTVSTLTFSDLQQLAVTIINSYQSGNLSDILNITINGVSVAEAMPPVTDPTWADVVEAGDDYVSVLKIPHTLHMKEHAQPASEGNPFSVQPKLHMLDVIGDQITLLGASIAPWQVSVSLKAGSGSNPSAVLSGTTNISFVSGWANFTDLMLSHEGSGYILEFTLSYPTDVVFTVESSPLTVTQRGLKAGVVFKTGNIFANDLTTVTLDIKDSTTNTVVTDIDWKGHRWQVTASMSSPTSFGYGGALAGTTIGSFDAATGQVSLSDLRFDQPGMAVIKFTVESKPPGYSFEVEEFIEVIPSEYNDVVEDTTKEMKLKVNQDFSTFGTQSFGASVVNEFLTSKSSYIRAKDMVLSEGSVVITVTVTGNTTTVQSIIDDACTSISAGNTFTYNGQTFTLSTYLTIDNVQYYGVNCGETDDDDDAKLGLLIGIVVCVVIIMALLAGFIYWRVVVYPKTKTHRRQSFAVSGLKDPKYLGQGGNPEDILWRENTFTSLREKSWLPPEFQPPKSTVFNEYPTKTTVFDEKKKNAFTGHA